MHIAAAIRNTGQQNEVQVTAHNTSKQLTIPSKLDGKVLPCRITSQGSSRSTERDTGYQYFVFVP